MKTITAEKSFSKILNKDNSVGLGLFDALPFEEWVQIGEGLKRCEQSVMW